MMYELCGVYALCVLLLYGLEAVNVMYVLHEMYVLVCVLCDVCVASVDCAVWIACVVFLARSLCVVCVHHV